MDFRYYHDADTGEPHIYNHGVSEREVEQVLRGSGEDFSDSQNTRIKLGQTSAGRYLKIVYVPEADLDSVFVITAYELMGHAKTAHRRRQRRKPK